MTKVQLHKPLGGHETDATIDVSNDVAQLLVREGAATKVATPSTPQQHRDSTDSPTEKAKPKTKTSTKVGATSPRPAPPVTAG